MLAPPPVPVPSGGISVQLLCSQLDFSPHLVCVLEEMQDSVVIFKNEGLTKLEIFIFKVCMSSFTSCLGENSLIKCPNGGHFMQLCNCTVAVLPKI